MRAGLGCVWAAAAIAVLALGGCDPKGPAAVDAARLTAADKDPGNWMSHGRTYSEQRFSPLDAIIAEARVPTPAAPAHHDFGAGDDTGVEVADAIADVVAQFAVFEEDVHRFPQRVIENLNQFLMDEWIPRLRLQRIDPRGPERAFGQLARELGADPRHESSRLNQQCE